MEHKYIKKIKPYSRDKKKVVSARVSAIVLEALSCADGDRNAIGYEFNVTDIIEKALNDTLDELREITWIDYYRLIEWCGSMEKNQNFITEVIEQYNRFNKESHKDTPFIRFDPVDFENVIKDCKDYQLMASVSNVELRDFESYLKETQDSIIKYWDSYLEDTRQKIEIRDNETIAITSIGKNPQSGFNKTPSGHSVETMSKLLKKSTSELINILDNAGITGLTADSRISNDDRKKLMHALSTRHMDGTKFNFK